MQNFLLRVLPYIISLCVGMAIYIVAELHMAHLQLYGLVVGVASGLLSIPLIFISYEAINKVCSQKLRNTLFEHLSFELNGLLLDLLSQLHLLLGGSGKLSASELDELLESNQESIAKRLCLSAANPDELNNVRDAILTSIQRHSHTSFEVLTPEEMHTLLSIRKEAGMVAREITRQRSLPPTEQSDIHLTADLVELIEHIGQWLESCEEEALANHRHFRFLKQ